MGACLPCLNGSSDDYDTPDPEVRRQQQAEAAEKRMKQHDGRGVKDPEALKRKQQRMDEAEKIANQQPQGEGGLKWSVG